MMRRLMNKTGCWISAFTAAANSMPILSCHHPEHAGHSQLGLREHIQRRKAFFSTKRNAGAENLVTEQEDEASLIRK